jgi:GNAT superfamily N-acetyltransferase
MAVTIYRASASEIFLAGGLGVLLQDCVHGGASLGFLSPLSLETAQRFWADILVSLGDKCWLWVAREGDTVVGSVVLSLCAKENGRHRAEVQKLLVVTSHRGQGIASRLMDALESCARTHRLTLLFLDTEAGSGAESLYKRLDWTRVGEIPDYAANPAGELHPTALYYKILTSDKSSA